MIGFAEEVLMLIVWVDGCGGDEGEAEEGYSSNVPLLLVFRMLRMLL